MSKTIDFFEPSLSDLDAFALAILLGSTTMLGTGTNIQNRCAAIHHIDAPWRPDEVEQREGRGLRPGNAYPVVELFRYTMRGHKLRVGRSESSGLRECSRLVYGDPRFQTNIV
jgi:hypothetical protein